MQAMLFFAICILATTVGGISGVGGGVIIKPVLDAITTLDVSTISFLSGTTVFAMTCSSILLGRNKGVQVEKRRGNALAIGAALGGVGGKALFELVYASGGMLVKLAQQTCMVGLTVLVFVYTLNRHRIRSRNVTNLPACVGIGLAMGALSAFLGIGGGPINLMVLYYFFSMDTKTAALNSLYVILFSQSATLACMLLGGSVPAFEPVHLMTMVTGGILGGRLGRALARRLSTKQTDKLFLVLLTVIILISVYNLWRLF